VPSVLCALGPTNQTVRAKHAARVKPSRRVCVPVCVVKGQMILGVELMFVPGPIDWLGMRTSPRGGSRRRGPVIARIRKYSGWVTDAVQQGRKENASSPSAVVVVCSVAVLARYLGFGSAVRRSGLENRGSAA